MARIRSIKPDACLSESLAEVSLFSALLFAYLPCFCDDQGRMKYSPALIKAQLFPLRNDVTLDQCKEAIAELAEVKSVTVYEDEDGRYLVINNFEKHQHPQKPKPSELPDPRDCFLVDLDDKKALPPAETIPVQYEYDTSTVQVNPAISEKNTVGVQEEYCTSTIPVQYSEENAARPADTIPVQYEYDTPPVIKGNSRVGYSNNNTKVSGKPDGASGNVKEIIDYLNAQIGTHYQATTPKTVKLVKARLREGFSVADFKRVIDVKRAEWGRDQKMARYLRPETLFGTKFESYLQQPLPAASTKGANYELYD